MQSIRLSWRHPQRSISCSDPGTTWKLISFVSSTKQSQQTPSAPQTHTHTHSNLCFSQSGNRGNEIWKVSRAVQERLLVAKLDLEIRGWHWRKIWSRNAFTWGWEGSSDGEMKLFRLNLKGDKSGIPLMEKQSTLSDCSFLLLRWCLWMKAGLES